jgi:hypothetical protein
MKFKKNNIEKWVYCLLALLPIMYVVCMTLFKETTNFDFMGELYTALADVPFGFLTDLNTSLFTNLITSSSQLLKTCIYYFEYLFILAVIDLVFNGLFILIRLIRSCIDKLCGGE